MCGIAGIWDRAARTGANELAECASAMAQRLQHRGPDDSGLWTDARAGIAMGFRRLAIIDVSSAGHQPMISHSGRYVIVFNGEIYNFRELRDALRRHGHMFRGTSDTEVLLAAVEEWGLESCLRKLNGMFAFALWDRHEETLRLARDRVGEKPLYYAEVGGRVLFGSELKALLAAPGFAPEVDRNSVALFLRHQYVPAPFTIYRDVETLPPGSSITFVGRAKLADSQVSRFWTMRDAAGDGARQPHVASDEELIDRLEAELRRAVALRMVADVPLGAFLSGGVDSSMVVALMQDCSSAAIRTFSIGFAEADFNEAQHGSEVARMLGTDHTELYVSSADALAVVPKLPELFDEPFADPSQIPTYLVSELARRDVTVSLSGDGGDELFSGYTRYRQLERIWGRVETIPRPLRKLAGRLLQIVPEDALQLTLSLLMRPGSSRARPQYRVRTLGELLRSGDPAAAYLTMSSHWPQPCEIVRQAVDLPTSFTDRTSWPSLDELTHRMMYLDAVTYLPDNVLVKLDRASMGVSLEARAPLLDHQVVEFAWRLPLSVKVRNGEGKWILKRVLDRYLPRQLYERPKRGFNVPVGTWLRGPLNEWARGLLEPERLAREGYLESAPIQKKWAEHMSGRFDWGAQLWTVLMFQAWLEAQGNVARPIVSRSAQEYEPDDGRDLCVS